MTTQLLIYESATPVNAERHRDWCVKAGDTFEFAKEVNSVPLTAVEFANAAAEYAIVFSGNDDTIMPVVILGLKPNENMYVEASGRWNARYVPAFIRRYPFVFASDSEGKTFTLCIDEQYQGCNQEGRGERLFDADGTQTQYIQQVLNFQREYQAHFQLTQAFCQKLKELDLLEPMHAMVTLGGERSSLGGFLGIQRERLKALDGEQLAALAKSDELELMYLHLQSIRNFPAAIERVATPDLSSEPAARPDAATAAS
ncbi:MAG: SapC family protein [Pseudomonadota bacterium]